MKLKIRCLCGADAPVCARPPVALLRSSLEFEAHHSFHGLRGASGHGWFIRVHSWPPMPFSMAEQAQRAHVFKVAFAAARGHRHNVVGVPEVAPRAPVLFELAPRCVVQFALVLAQRFGIRAAQGADAAIAREDLLPQVAGIGAQLPFMHAGGAAKRETSPRHFPAAPSARTALPRDPSTGLGPARAHTRSS